MTILDDHKLRMDYTGQYGQYTRAELGKYLEGKPDNDGWRSTFAFNRAVPIPRNGLIFPHWALLDLYTLMTDSPGIEEQILHEGRSLSDLPPLDEVAYALSKHTPHTRSMP